jgi:hypothetical protein
LRPLRKCSHIPNYAARFEFGRASPDDLILVYLNRRLRPPTPEVLAKKAIPALKTLKKHDFPTKEI